MPVDGEHGVHETSIIKWVAELFFHFRFVLRTHSRVVSDHI